jgi:DeoR/GlpR family transcriptional regulator of sugar metabolism
MNTLSGLPDITVIALGGFLRQSELSFIGHIAEQALAEVRADKVIIGIHAISIENGLTNDYLPETMTDRAILKAGREVIVVADHTKINAVAASFLTPITSIQRFVTDSAPVDFLAAVQEKGITITIA